MLCSIFSQVFAVWAKNSKIVQKSRALKSNYLVEGVWQIKELKKPRRKLVWLK